MSPLGTSPPTPSPCGERGSAATVAVFAGIRVLTTEDTEDTEKHVGLRRKRRALPFLPEIALLAIRGLKARG